jgi:hypothetical protein
VSAPNRASSRSIRRLLGTRSSAGAWAKGRSGLGVPVYRARRKGIRPGRGPKAAARAAARSAASGRLRGNRTLADARGYCRRGIAAFLMVHMALTRTSLAKRGVRG